MIGLKKGSREIGLFISFSVDFIILVNKCGSKGVITTNESSQEVLTDFRVVIRVNRTNSLFLAISGITNESELCSSNFIAYQPLLRCSVQETSKPVVIDMAIGSCNDYRNKVALVCYSCSV